MLAWACTIHTVQGIALEDLYVLFNLIKQKTFSNGQSLLHLVEQKVSMIFFMYQEKLKIQWSDQTKMAFMNMKAFEKK